MSSMHLVVDGSNIATEGRSLPSLAQLEEAVAELRREYPEAEVTVIVDATFSHRIDPSELDHFETEALAGRYVHPPAGAIGRGDAFLLRVAERVDATVVSNDSFQEFHGEHPWLFDRGRLLGATPVPGVGWIFTPRTPVRGPRSHQAVRDTAREKRKVSKAIEAATKEAVAPTPARTESAAAPAEQPAGSSGRGRRQSGARGTPAAVNDPLTFVSFIAEHPLGAEVEGRVESYTSHGAVVFVGPAECYVPLANMSDPPPRSAREVLRRGETRAFVVTALDPQRRGVELTVPGVGAVSGRPSEEMIAAEVELTTKQRAAGGGRARGAAAASEPDRAPVRRARRVAPSASSAEPPEEAEEAVGGEKPPAVATKEQAGGPRRRRAAAGSTSDSKGAPVGLASSPEPAPAAAPPAAARTRARKAKMPDAAPSAKKAAPSAKKAAEPAVTPSAKKAAPAVTPSAKKAAPSAKKDAPAAKKATPGAKKAAPAVTPSAKKASSPSAGRSAGTAAPLPTTTPKKAATSAPPRRRASAASMPGVSEPAKAAARTTKKAATSASPSAVAPETGPRRSPRTTANAAAAGSARSASSGGAAARADGTAAAPRRSARRSGSGR